MLKIDIKVSNIKADTPLEVHQIATSAIAENLQGMAYVHAGYKNVTYNEADNTYEVDFQFYYELIKMEDIVKYGPNIHGKYSREQEE